VNKSISFENLKVKNKSGKPKKSSMDGFVPKSIKQENIIAAIYYVTLIASL